MMNINEINRIYLGIQGENECREITIDVSAWIAMFPNGSVTIWHKRNGDEVPSATGATFDADKKTVTWSPTSTDTFVAGEGVAEIRLTDNSVIKKSREIMTGVSPAVTLAGTTLGSDWASYIDAVDGLRSAAVSAKEDAEGAKEDAEDAAEDAEASAEDAEAWAVGQRGGMDVSSDDPTYENNAKYYADVAKDAKDDAETAKQYAEDAQTAAETAAGHGPQIDTVTGNWKTWDAEDGQYEDTGVHAKGDKGDPGDPTELIDDDAGEGDTDKVWSADKTDAELSGVKSAISDIASGEKVEINATIAGSGYCIVASTGATTASTMLSYTDYLDISKYESLIYKSVGYSSTAADVSGFAFYDEDMVYVAGYKYPVGQSANGYLSELQIVTVPNGAKYVRFGVFTDPSTYGNFELYGVLPIIQNFIDIDREFDNVIPANSKTYEGNVTKESVIDFSFTGRIYSMGELIPAETGYKSSDYIDLKNVTGIYRTGTTTMFSLWRYAFYDENKTCIGSVDDTTSYTIVTYNGKQVTWLNLSGYPNAKYIRISMVPTRPYTYYVVKNCPVYSYDIPHFTVNGAELQKFYGKKIVNFGDSLFGNFRDTNTTTDKSISKMIAEATGATVYNCGFGGCRMGYHSEGWRAFSMYALADAIATGVWTAQDAAISSPPTGMPEYFADTLALLKTIDFTKVDYITIGYGVNDFNGNAYIDARTGLEEYQYFKGALAYSLRTILTAYPNIRIIDITPCWIWYPDSTTGLLDYDSDDEQAVNSRGLTLPQFVEACKTVCEQYHVPCIDTYTELGFNPYSYKAYFNVKGIDGAAVSDGVHPKQSGRQLRADRIVGKMESLY